MEIDLFPDNYELINMFESEPIEIDEDMPSVLPVSFGVC
jgi:hypothetical protein